MLLHLPQLILPWNLAALDALDHKLPVQRGIGISRPDHLADGLGASALNRDQVSYLYFTRTEQPRATRMDVIGASEFRQSASAVVQVSQANRQRQVNQLLEWRAIS